MCIIVSPIAAHSVHHSLYHLEVILTFLYYHLSLRSDSYLHYLLSLSCGLNGRGNFYTFLFSVKILTYFTILVIHSDKFFALQMQDII